MIVSSTGLTKSFPQLGGAPVEILHGIDVSVREGEFVAIVGPSGSGKSTLLHCLLGLERPTGGRVEIAGLDTARASASALAKLRRSTVGFVFQSYNLVQSLTARQNVALQVRLAKMPAARASEALTAVGLAHRENAYPAYLSGGEQQRVAIARAIAVEPRVLFADEPTGALDSVTGDAVLAILRDAVAQRACAVILVTHDLEAASRADRVLVLRDGSLYRELIAPTPAQILEAVEAPLPAAHGAGGAAAAAAAGPDRGTGRP